MEQDQYAVVWNGMIIALEWAENIIDAGAIFAQKNVPLEQSTILNMTRLVEAECLEFPDKVEVV